MKFKTKKKRSLPPIDTSSLPDIIFILLFFFMVATVIKKEKVMDPVDVPKVDYAELMKENDVIVLGLIKNEGQLFYLLNGKRYVNIQAMESALVKSSLEQGHKSVKLVGDQEIKMRDINQVKQILQKQGLFKVDYFVKTMS